MGLRDRLLGAAFGGTESLGEDLRLALRKARRVERRTHTIPAKGTERGRVLLAYRVDGFFHHPDAPAMASHTSFWECATMAMAWSDHGYRVDVINNDNLAYRPSGRYDILVGARMILESLATRIEGDPLKIFHVDTSHWLAHNLAQLRRLRGIHERRGVALAPRKLIEVNRAAEVADVATVLGNDVTMETYAFSGVPKHRLRISSVTEMDWIERDMESARRAFLWLGSDGLVHKGLDLVLEAFAELPDLDLYVCGPLDKEKDFLNEYRRELHECPNIHPVGWVDVRGPQWLDVARRCVAIVYPSCAEGDPGCIATATHFGLIPVVTRSASVDVTPETGVLIRGESVGEIQEAVCALAERTPAHLTAMSRAAWCLARTQNTRTAFAARYREVIRQLVPGG